VDEVLKGGDGKAGELHGIKAKLVRGLSWSEKEGGELTTAWWSMAEGERGGDPVETKSRKATFRCCNQNSQQDKVQHRERIDESLNDGLKDLMIIIKV
jgi:hypothetical protein